MIWGENPYFWKHPFLNHRDHRDAPWLVKNDFRPSGWDFYSDEALNMEVALVWIPKTRCSDEQCEDVDPGDVHSVCICICVYLYIYICA